MTSYIYYLLTQYVYYKQTECIDHHLLIVR